MSWESVKQEVDESRLLLEVARIILGSGAFCVLAGLLAGRKFVLVNRPLPYRVLSALLALLVLATSVGLTAERHRCRISGRSTVALSLPGFVPKEDVGTATKPGRPCGKRRATGCCDVSYLQHKLNAQAPTASLAKWLPAPPLLPPALLPEPVWLGLAATGAYLVPAVAVGYAANSSPPGQCRAGRVLLAFVCTLVV